MNRNVSAVSSRQNPKLGRIRIYPFKSLDPIECQTARFTSDGALENDRRFAFLLTGRTFFNAKKDPRIHRIRFVVSARTGTYQFSIKGTNNRIDIDPTAGFKQLEHWISKHLDVQTTVSENLDRGFPDDLQASGPTIISQATIETIASWYPSLTGDDIRDRLRANLEIENVPPFWEDTLCSELGANEVKFSIGPAILRGINPCQRCVVPSRDHQTGVALSNFSKIFQSERQNSLPTWAPHTRFNHFYRAAINTTAQNNHKGPPIKVGDEISIKS